MLRTLLFFYSVLFIACTDSRPHKALSDVPMQKVVEKQTPKNQTTDIHHSTFYPKDRVKIVQRLEEKITAKQPLTIHVFVPLCDNKYQGIVPVPKALGDGQNPHSNLYWGALYGVKTHFSKSSKWKRMGINKDLEQPLLEQVIFQRNLANGTPVYLVADAYDGSQMRACVVDYLQSLAGQKTGSVTIGGKEIKLFAEADLLVFNGHDGLMDFDDIPYYLNVESEEANIISKEAVIIACYSGSFFSPYLQKASAYPLVVTTNLMAPEAYVLEGIFEQWLTLKPAEEICKSAGVAYNQYQKCGARGADRLFDTGW